MVHTRERIFPSGSIDLLVNLGPDQRVIVPGTTLVLSSGAVWLSGLQRQPLLVESSFRVHMFCVQLRPAAAASMLAAPMGVAGARVIPFQDVRRDIAVALRNAVDGTHCFDERLTAVCYWLEQRCGSLRRPDYIGWIAGRLESTGGTVSIEAVRRAAGVSRKKLAADFRAQIGVTPKVLARILRFRRARTVLQNGAASLADAAAACGYFDQSHMAREFRELGAVSPSEFLVTSYPDGNSVIV